MIEKLEAAYELINEAEKENNNLNLALTFANIKYSLDIILNIKKEALKR